MNLFQKTKLENDNRGICVSVEELIKQQQYLPYLSIRGNYITSNRVRDVKSAFKGRGMEFEEIREYNFGDDVRDIDWRVTARKSEPFTKIYNEEKDREITVFLDLSASMVFGTKNEFKSVAAAKITALLGWLSVKNKDRFGVVIYDGENITYFKPQSSMQNLMAIFKKISDISCEILKGNKLSNLSEALKTLEFKRKGQGIIFILSDFYSLDSDGFKKIAALSKSNKIYCVDIFDIIEDIAPKDGVYAVQYAGEKVVFDSSGKGFKDEYKKYFAENRENVKKNCQKFSCGYIEIRTDAPIFKQLRVV